MKRPPIHLYVLHCEDRYKIGLATNISKRLTSLRIGCPFPIDVVRSYELPSVGEVELERCLHRIFADRRVTGEWFALTPFDRVVLDWYVTRYIELRGRKWVGDPQTVERELFGSSYGSWRHQQSYSVHRVLPHRDDLLNCLIGCLNVLSQHPS